MDEKLYTHALRFLTVRPRSEKEVRESLLKKQAPSAQIELIITRLKEQKFLNDMDFAEWWIEQRLLLRPKGWRSLSMELMQKGIGKDVLREVEIKFKNQQLSEKSELETALDLVSTKVKKFEGLSKDEVYRKLGGFLARRGFSLDVIKAVIDQVTKK